jgi:peptidoglycan/LPS O-acetylase OafA/YrhL
MQYRPEIDGLRAVAVIPVIFFHAGFNFFSGGFVGVDVFFVISGYLITTIILSELEEDRFSIINFWERRARRILPALFVVLLACLPFAWFWLLPSDMKSFSQSLASIAVFSSNFFFLDTSGYFDTAAELKPLLHTWSLSVEEQCYLIFPVFLILVWRLGKRWTLTLLAIFALVSLALAQWLSTVAPSDAFYLLPTRSWELLIGTFIAFYFSNKNRVHLSKSAGEVGGLAGLALLTYAVFAFDKGTPFPSLYALVPTLGTGLVILCTTQQTAVGKVLSNKVFVGIGLISYSAYLRHQPLFAFARLRNLDDASELLLAALAFASIGLAYFSWKDVEQPFRNKHKFDRKHMFLYGAIGSTLFVSIGLTGHLI